MFPLAIAKKAPTARLPALAARLLLLPLLLTAPPSAAFPAGSGNGATYNPPFPNRCFSDKAGGVRAPGFPDEFCRCRSWATVWYSTLGGNNSFQVNIVDASGQQIDPTATWPYPGGMGINYELIINGTVNRGYLTLMSDIQAGAVPVSRLLTGQPGGGPMPGVTDGANEVTFRLTAGAFLSTDIEAIFGGGEAMLPHVAHPFTINGESTRLTQNIMLSTTD